MEPIKVLIVEDELLIAADLAAKLRDHKFEVLQTVSSGEEALAKLNEEIPDLILMDIQLAGKRDGIATAEAIKEYHDIPVIYLTDYTDKETVDRAIKTHPANYLAKPFNISTLLRSLELAFANYHNNTTRSLLKDRIFIRTDRQSAEMIHINDILYLEAVRSYSIITTASKEFILSNSMKKVINQFSRHPDFLRIHRSYIINIKQVTGMEGNMIKLGPGHELPVSRGFKQNVQQIFSIIK